MANQRWRRYRRRLGHNATGRDRTERFVLLRWPLLKSLAWQSLRPTPRQVYVSLRMRFNGSNNGEISTSVRELEDELHISKNTAGRALQELQEKGFIRCRQKGSFHWKDGPASTWILTEEAFGDDLPSKEYSLWRPTKKNAVPK